VPRFLVYQEKNEILKAVLMKNKESSQTEYIHLQGFQPWKWIAESSLKTQWKKPVEMEKYIQNIKSNCTFFGFSLNDNS